MKQLTKEVPWQALKAHHILIASNLMQNWFADDSERFNRFSLEVGDIFLDYSKNRITQETLSLLCDLAHAANLTEKIDALFTGQIVNTTEQRPALHTALRNRSNTPVFVNNKDVMLEVNAVLEKMDVFTQKVRSQEWKGVTGKPIRDIVTIGIGGSHLGPQMIGHALSHLASKELHAHFISNIDSVHLNAVLQVIDPEASLFIISSKTFTTIETMTNTRTIFSWLQQKLGKQDITKHFVAVTTAPNKAREFGILEEHIFPFWEWVGGRYSVWSAIGLPIALMIGMERFLEFLAGAHAMDEHFRHAEFSANMPVILALLGIWYINFFDARNHAIIPYAHQLNYFHQHLQQLDMESNGKRISLQGSPVDYLTGPVIFGEHGCDGQHAFYQSLHQGPQLVPIDFLLVGTDVHGLPHHQDMLVASCLSQAQAFMQGKSFAHALAELLSQGVAEETALNLAQHKMIPGNRPNNLIFIKEMTPYNLGALLALYEHKIFVQGVIWNINSFDQWGVELGKQLLPPILNDLTQNVMSTQHDASTAGLIQHYNKLKKK